MCARAGFAYASFAGRPAEAYRRDAATYPQSGLVFAGLISLVDPPTPGVEEAIDTCRDAFMRVTMVTGDHPLTAEAIARKVGIITLPTARDVAFAEGLGDESEVPKGALLDDSRFASLFTNPDFAISRDSEEYQALHPHAKELNDARASRLKAARAEESEDGEDDEEAREEEEARKEVGAVRRAAFKLARVSAAAERRWKRRSASRWRCNRPGNT